MENPPTSLCIINHNGEGYLEETLGAATAIADSFREIILVDNASSDNSLKLTEQQFPGVTIVRLPDNRGPGKARNAGFQNALCDRILFIDNDVRLPLECAPLLNRALDENPQATIAMPSVIYEDDRKLVQYDGADSHFLGLMILHNENRPLEDPPPPMKPLSTLVSCAFLMDRGRWGDTLPFDDSFFMYFDDHEFGMHARVWGNGILAVPAARIYHREGSPNLSLRLMGSYMPIRIFNTIKNRWQIILKYFSLRTIVLLSPAFLLYELFQLAGVVKKGWLGHWLKAAGWILRHFPAVIRRRRFIQQHRRTPDRDILQGGPLPFARQLQQGALEKSAIAVLNSLLAAYWRLVRPLL